MSMKKKRLCSNNKDWEKEYEWFSATNNPQQAKCIMCNSTFMVDYMGVVSIKQHKTFDSHSSNCNALQLTIL